MRELVLLKVFLSIVDSSHKTIRAFACVVDKEYFPNAIEMAFEDLNSRFDMFLGKQPGNKGLMILDKSKDESMILDLSRMYRKRGTKWRKVHTLPEVPLFVNSRDSRLIQIADHIAYSVFRRYERGDASYLDMILDRFTFDGTLHNLVHKTRKKNCSCIACVSRRS